MSSRFALLLKTRRGFLASDSFIVQKFFGKNPYNTTFAPIVNRIVWSRTIGLGSGPKLEKVFSSSDQTVQLHYSIFNAQYSNTISLSLLIHVLVSVPLKTFGINEEKKILFYFIFHTYFTRGKKSLMKYPRNSKFAGITAVSGMWMSVNLSNWMQLLNGSIYLDLQCLVELITEIKNIFDSIWQFHQFFKC